MPGISLSMGIGLAPRRGAGGGGGGTTPTYTAQTPMINPNYAVANNTLLRNIAPFTAISRTGSVANTKDEIAFDSANNYLNTNSVTGQIDGTTVGDFLIAANTTTARHYVEADVALAAAVNVKMSLGGINNGQHIEVGPTGAGVAVWNGASGAETRTVIPVDTQPQYLSATARGLNGREAAAGNVFRAKVFDNKVYFERNGISVASFTITPVGGTNIGCSTNAVRPYRGVRNMRGNPIETVFTINELNLAYNLIEGYRGFPNGGRRVPVSGTWTGRRPVGLLWRTLDYETGALVRQWAGIPPGQVTITQTGANPNGPGFTGTWTAQPDISAGANGSRPEVFCIGAATDPAVDYGLGAGVKTGPDFNNKSQFGHFVIAQGNVFVGQSETDGINSQLLSGGIASFTGGYWFVSPAVGFAMNNGWARDTVEDAANRVGDRQSAFFCKLLAEATGLPQTCTFVSIGATLAEDLVPPSANWTNYIQPRLAAIGCFSRIIWNHGSAHMNAGGVGTWQPSWLSGFPAYLALANQPTPPRIYQVPTGFGNAPGEVGTAAQIGNANALRAIQAAFPATAAGSGLTVIDAANFLDLTVDATGEFTTDQRSGGIGGQRVALTIAKTENKTGGGWGVFDGRGPLPGTPTRAGAVITLPYAANGATSLAGPLTLGLWKASTTADMLNPVTINSVAISGFNIIITLAADPGTIVYFKNYDGFGPAQTGHPLGNYANGMVIPAKPIMVPLATSS